RSLEGRGQAPSWVQRAEGADALGQVGWVDWHGAACLSGTGLANRSAGPCREAARLPSGPTAVAWEGRTGAGSGRLPPSRWPQANGNNAHNCTPATLSLNPTHKPVAIGGHARWLFGLVQPRAAPVAADALCRAGWPSPRLPASTARGCFHASTQPRQLPSSILFGRWPAAIDTYQRVSETGL